MDVWILICSSQGGCAKPSASQTVVISVLDVTAARVRSPAGKQLINYPFIGGSQCNTPNIPVLSYLPLILGQCLSFIKTQASLGTPSDCYLKIN